MRARRRSGTAARRAPDVQGLEGALKTDRTEVRCRRAFTPNAFQDELQILVNLPETIQTDLERAAGLRRGLPE